MLLPFARLLEKKAGSNVSIDFVAAADMMQKLGKARTATQQKAELADVDVAKSGKCSLIEFLLLHYKVMILQSYFRRIGVEPDVDLSTDGVGLVGVGERLVMELYSPPLGLDPVLEKLMKDFAISHAEKEKKIKDLEAVIAAGGVKAMSAKTEFEKLTSTNDSEWHHIEAKINAATKKAAAAAEKLLAEKEAARVAADDDKKAASKGGLASKTGAFSS